MKSSESTLINLIKTVKPWYLLVLTVISAAVCIYALRSNNEHMSQLRSQVYAADKNGGNVEAALENLAKYVTSNMNTSLSSGPNGVYPPIQLQYSYGRVSDNQAQTLQQQNSSLYTEAEDYCQSQIPNGFSGRYRIPCIEQYVTSHGLAQANIPLALYEFDFVSPSWSPDLAGWTLLASIFLGLMTIASFIATWLVKRSDKQKSWASRT